eukprot:309269-Amphidinium_carterae.1
MSRLRKDLHGVYLPLASSQSHADKVAAAWAAKTPVRVLFTRSCVQATFCQRLQKRLCFGSKVDEPNLKTAARSKF